MSRLHSLYNNYSRHFFLLIFIFLFGCSRYHINLVIMDDKRGLPRHVPGASDKKAIQLQTELKRCGVKVVTIGENYLVSMPSAMLFANESPRLTWESYQVLNKVVLFLRQFRKVAVNVTAYSNKCISAKRDHALTLARARAVGDYLWSQCIDSRFIFTEGLGSDKPIMAYTRGGDNSYNSRIEITFRDAII